MNVNILLVPIILPAASGLLILFLPKGIKWIREILAVVTSAIAFAAALQIFLLKDLEFQLPLLEIGKLSLDFDLASTSLSSFILIFLTGFALLISLYSLSYMAGRSRLKEYYAFLMFALAGSCGVLTANHFLVFLIFWEVVTASLYFLITTGGPEARGGATRTFAMLGAADGCLLLGIGILWYLSRSFTINAIHIEMEGWLSYLAFLLMMVGAITKAGAIPFHTWIPAASEGAPAPVMAFLPAALDKLLGIYLLIRIATGIFTLNNALGLVLMIIGSVTIIAAVMAAMMQHDLRRLLAYLSICQVGYMVLGIGTLNPIGLVGGLFHMLNCAIYTCCLFLCAGAVERKTNSSDLGELGGLAKVMPVTFTACLISALAISGIPPFNGFVSKWLVYQGVIEAGSNYHFIFLIAAMFGSALTLASFIKVIYSLFLGRKSEKTKDVKREVGFGMQLPLLILALLCLIFGVFYRIPLEAFIYPGIGLEAAPTGIWNSTLAAIFILTGLLLGLIVYWIARIGKTARVAGTFIGGEVVESETIRVAGTHFYDTIKAFPVLKKTYAAQERGVFDLYVQLGRLGLGITALLKVLHNGLLSRYLSWSLLGMVVLLFLALFLL